MKQLLFIAIALTSLMSCSSLKSTTNISKTLPIYGAGVIQKPVVVALEV